MFKCGFLKGQTHCDGVSGFGMGNPFIIPWCFGLNGPSKQMPLAGGKGVLGRDRKTLRPQAQLPGYISWLLASFWLLVPKFSQLSSAEPGDVSSGTE